MIRLTRIAPTSHNGRGFVDGYDADGNPWGGFRTDLPVWDRTPEGERLRQWRCDRGWGLGALATRLGIGVADLSGLETGRCAPVDGWDVVWAALDDVDAKEAP